MRDLVREGNVTHLPDPLPRVHQCGCGSQAFHLCADGRVVCLECRYIIETLSVSVVTPAPLPPVIHTCHFPGCTQVVVPKLWGCRRHWLMLPLRLRNMIWKHYRPGQEVDKNPSPGYIEAARTVRDYCVENFRGEIERLKTIQPTAAGPLHSPGSRSG